MVVLLIEPSGQQWPSFLDDERRGFMDIVARLLKEDAADLGLASARWSALGTRCEARLQTRDGR